MANDWFLRLRDITIFFAACMLIKYWIFLMVAPWYRVKEKLRRRRLTKRDIALYQRYSPLVSVIVPAWNEEVGILKTIKSLLNNSYQNLEIIVVNDGSEDASDHIMRNFLQRYRPYQKSGKSIKYFYKQNGGKGTALNHGIEQSSGEIIVTMDADSVFEHQAIANFVEYFKDPKIDAAVGRVIIANNRTLVGHLQQLEYLFGFYFKRTHSVLNAEYIFGGACAAFRRRKTFDRFGLFDVSNKTEDIEMSLRTRYHGLRAVLAEDVVCYTEGASNLTGLVNQRLRWKKGRFDTFGKYRQMFFSFKREHNFWLSFFVLPFSLLGELQLLFEPIGIALLTSYSVISGDYLSLGLSILFVFAAYLFVSLFGADKFNIKVLAKFPFTWPLFYITTWVEYIVLLRSAKMIIRGTELQWQRWERKGIDSSSLTELGVSGEKT